jgi:hypothetical protein
MNKIIAMSVWGKDPRYIIGAKRQIELAKEFYPDWIIRLYVDDTSSFAGIPNIDLREVRDGTYGMFWRFEVLFEDNICLVRDSDSRITIREAMAVNEWLDGHKKFHTFKDHDAHYEFPIIGCAFGYRGKLHSDVKEKMQQYIKNYPFYLGDQFFLRDIVWPMVKDDALVHSMKEGWFKESRAKLKNRYSFCGNGYTEEDIPIYPPSLSENNTNVDLAQFKFDKGLLQDE